MAEMLMHLHEELQPSNIELALKQAQQASSPPEDEKTTQEREAVYLAELNTVFKAINDEKTTEAIKSFKEFVLSGKPKIMTDNRYHLNLLHLYYLAVDVLEGGGGELKGGWYGPLGDRFCSEVICDAIQDALPPAVRQKLKCGVYQVFTWRSKSAAFC